MTPSNLDKELVLQTLHNVRIKLEVLDEDLQVINEIQGQATAMTVSISSTSDIRRTCNLTIHIVDDSFSDENFEIEYLDRLVKISIGLYNDSGSAYVWYLIGSLLLDTDTYNYDATTNELSMNLVDMMAATADVRGSQIGSAVLIPYESNVRTALIATIARFSPFAFYDVDELPDTIPFDQEFSSGAYPYAILKQLLDLFPTYQMYYSNDGIFTVKPIPTGIGSAPLVDKTFMDKIIISERRSGSLRNIKNTTEIWGAELDATYMANSVLHEGDTFHVVHTAPVTALVADTMFMFSPPISSIVGQRIKIDATAVSPLYDSKGDPLAFGALTANRLYVAKYSPTLDDENEIVHRFLLQGEAIIHVIIKEVNVMPDAAYIAADKIANNCNDIQYIVNPDSPFACNRGTLDYDEGEIRQVFSGGDYSKIYTTQLAFERAAYENWLKTRLQTEAEIECLLVPWIDVNTKIEYTSPITGIARQYMVKEVSMNPAEFTMSLKLSRFYNYYPFI